MLAVSTAEATLGGFALILILIIAAVWLARHDRVTRVKLGIFFEREREREEEEPPSEQQTKIQGRWPGEKPGERKPHD